MNTSFTIHEHGDQFTVKVNSTAMGSPVHAALSGTAKYALIDGLLWFTINRKLDQLVATAMGQPRIEDRNQALSFGNALNIGEDLVMRTFRAPFYDTTEAKQQRIMHYLAKELPALEPLTRHGAHAPMAKAELAKLLELCTILAERIAHPADAMHGMQGLITTITAAAA
jgi:hypothetical protein